MISCRSLDDFITNLSGNTVYNNRVFYDRSRRRLNGTSNHDATSFEIYLQFSAVLEFGDGGQALVTGGEYCGVLRTTRDGTTDGVDKQTELIGRLTTHCEERKLTLLPGIVDQ